MLANKLIFPTLPVVDLGRARAFYEEKLGLKAGKVSEGGVMYECGGGTMLFIYQREQSKADHTEASFVVDDLENEVDELRGKGIAFEDYDMPGIKTENGIASMDGMKSAWFKDTEENILNLTQM